MFYLLENNRIIDSAIPYSKNFPFWEESDGFLYGKSVKNNIVRPYKGNKIKKQSENVYDLIDWEQDLVRVDDNIFCCKYFYSKEEYLTNKWFNAIYKPNSKGDYIKVWEGDYIEVWEGDVLIYV